MKLMPLPCAIAGPLGSVRVIKSIVPVLNDKIKMPIRKPRSANLVTINAFFDALTAEGF